VSVETRRLEIVETHIGYEFKDKALALCALTHSSFGDGQRQRADNERLEFLGDRVLGLMTAEKLYEVCPGNEGALARRLNALVRKETCARIAKDAGLDAALLMSKSEEKQNGREKNSILGDACEAFIAALYIDGGYGAAKDFFDKFWAEDVVAITAKAAKDPKTELQERAAARGHDAPIYAVVDRGGPDHKPSYIIDVSVGGAGTGRGEGTSKKMAQRLAAKNLLKKWGAP